LGGDVAPLTEGMTISLDTLCSFNIRADPCNSPQGSVKFLLNGDQFSIENSTPFALAGDNPTGSYHPWTPEAGDYTLTAIPYSGQNASGQEGRSLTVQFTLTGTACRLRTAIGDLNDHGLSLEVYPNPFDELLMVNLIVEAPSNGNLRVMDVIGKELVGRELELIPGSNTLTLDFENQIAEGIYFLEVRLKDEVKVVKLVKE
jgi:hypothetical protein